MADEVVTLGVEIEVDKAVKHMMTFERQMKRKMDNITKAVGNLGHQNARVLGKAIELSEDWMDETDKLILTQKKEFSALVDLGGQIEAMEVQVGKLSGTQKKAAQENLNRMKKQGKSQAQALAKGLGKKGAFVKVTGEINEAIKKGIEAASPAVTSFFGKDLKGTIEGTMSFAGKALSKSIEGAGIASALGGGFLSKKGAKLSGKGKERGGVGGGAMKAGGAAMKGLGSVMSKMAPILQIVGKLGPLIGTLSSLLMAVVKVLIDAEAQAKAFNKEILASASSAEFLARSGGNANDAYDELSNTMDQLRDSAYSLENLEWGISVDEHKQVLNVLTQEGVAIGHIKAEAGDGAGAVGKFATELSHVSVAYSRAFGVPLQEINQMQAEMMNSMGMNLESTKLAFEQMNRAAGDSGISANKFFGMIRGVSQDLSLYNVRMEQSVKLLKMLGKVMDPRNAQKFMQGVIGTMKNMSQDDRLKVALLAGGKGKAIVQKDLANKRKNLQADIGKAIGMEADAVGKELADPAKAKALWAKIGKKAPGKLGALKESSIELKIDETASKKGVYGQAFAMENMGVGGQLEMMQAALAGWGGGKTLTEGAGSLGMTKMAENMGIGTEQLRGMMKLEQAVKEEKAALLAAAKTDEEKAKINAMGTQDIIDGMSKEEQKVLKEGTKSTLDFAKQQGQLTQSLLDKLSVLVDFVMNQLYNVFIDIWTDIGAILTKFGIGEAEGTRELKTQVARSKNADIQKALSDATSSSGAINESEFRGNALTNTGAYSGVAEAMKNWQGVESGGGPQERAATNKAMEELSRVLYTGLSNIDPKELKNAVNGAGLGPQVEAAINKGLDEGKSLESALRGAGAGKETQAKVMSEAVRYLPSSALIQGGIGEKLATAGKGVGQARVAGAKGDRKAFDDYQKLDGPRAPGDMAPDFSGFDESKAAASIQSTAEDAKKTAEKTAQFADDGHKDGSIYVKYGTSFLQGKYKKTIEEAVLDAVRSALFEYYLYSEEEDRGKLLDEMHNAGLSPSALAKELSVGDKTVGGALGYKVEAKKTETKGPEALGGIVTGISNGLANVRAAAGEGLTSIGTGEVIVPKGGTLAGAGGGGATRVEISVQRGFEQFIRATVTEEIQNFKSRERFG